MCGNAPPHDAAPEDSRIPTPPQAAHHNDSTSPVTNPATPTVSIIEELSRIPTPPQAAHHNDSPSPVTNPATPVHNEVQLPINRAIHHNSAPQSNIATPPPIAAPVHNEVQGTPRSIPPSGRRSRVILNCRVSKVSGPLVMQPNGHKKRIAIKYGTVIRYIPDRKWLVVWDEDGTQIEEFANKLRFVSSPLTDTNNNVASPPLFLANTTCTHSISYYQHP